MARRGGLEGFGDPSMGPEEFQAFFKQIRAFLTVQEQVDLFSRWAEASAAADFLASTALTASGFAQRKPERIAAARERLEASGQDGLQPLLACLHLLLGQVDKARSAFEQGATPELKRWAEQQSSDSLAQLCAYCRDWLARDVLPGYRDLEADPDLEAYFADRDVQAYVEQHDSPSERLPAPAENAFAWNTGSAPVSAAPASPSGGFLEQEDEDEQWDWDGTDWLENLREAWDSHGPASWMERMPQWQWHWQWPSRRTTTGVAVAAGVALLAIASFVRLRSPAPGPGRTPIAVQPVAPPAVPIKPTAPVKATPAAEPSLPLREEAPSEAQVQALLEAWLDAKAAILAGKDSRIPLEVLARPSQLDRLASERDADQARGETQTISTDITNLVINERDTNRIAATVGLSYTDQRLNAKGDPQGEPSKMELRNLYVFGRDGGIWRLVSFQKAP